MRTTWLISLLLLIVSSPILASTNLLHLSDISQDKKGYVWLASSYMLVRKDPHFELSVFDALPNIPKQKIESIKVTDSGVVIAGASGVYHISSDIELLNSIELTTPAIDAEIYNGHTAYATNTTLTVIPPNKPEHTYSIPGIRELLVINNQLYYRTRANFCQLEGKCIPQYFFDVIVQNNQIILSKQSGLSIYNTELELLDDVDLPGVTFLSQSVHADRIWVDQYQEIYQFDLSAKKLIGTQIKRTGKSRLHGLYQTREGVLWILSNNTQVAIEPFYTEVWQYDSPIQPPNLALTAHNGILYGGGTTGLYEYHKDKRIKVKNAPAYIFEMLSTPEGLWIASYYGLYLYNNGKFKDLGLTGMAVCLAIENDQYLLTCNLNTVVRIDRQRLIHADEQAPWDETKYDYVSDVLPGNPSYVGTSTGIVVRDQEGNIFTMLNDASILTAYRSEQEPELVFFFSENNGFFIYNEITKDIKTFNSLPLFSVCETVKEHEANFWIACKDMVVIVERGSLEYQVISVASQISQIERMGDQFYSITSDDEIASWDANIKISNYIPELLITQLLVNGSNKFEEIVSGNHVEVYAALTDFHSGNNYSFMLNDDILRDFNNNSSIGFNPSAGKNTLKITSRNYTGNSVTKTFEFYVQRPVYLRWYAILGYTFAIYILFITYRKRIQSDRYQMKLEEDLNNEKRLLKRERFLKNQLYFRTRFVPGFHKAIESKIKTMHIPLDEKPHFETLVDLAEDGKQFIPEPIYQKISQLSRVINSNLTILQRYPNTSLKNLIDIWQEEQRHKLGSRIDISCVFSVDTIFPEHVNQYLFFVIQNLANNACYKANANKVDIMLEEVGEHIILSVRDNGKGFNEKTHQDGETLYWVRTTVEWLGGNIEFHFLGENRGTEISIWLDNETLINHDPNPEKNTPITNDDLLNSLYEDPDDDRGY